MQLKFSCLSPLQFLKLVAFISFLKLKHLHLSDTEKKKKPKTKQNKKVIRLLTGIQCTSSK